LVFIGDSRIRNLYEKSKVNSSQGSFRVLPHLWNETLPMEQTFCVDHIFSAYLIPMVNFDDADENGAVLATRVFVRLLPKRTIFYKQKLITSALMVLAVVYELLRACYFL